MLGDNSIQPATLRPLSITTESLAPAERFDFLNDCYAKDNRTLAPSRHENRLFSASFDLWQIGALRYSTNFSTGNIGRRHGRSGDLFIGVHKCLTGTLNLWSPENTVIARAGDIVISLDSGNLFYECSEMESVRIALPLDVLDVDPSLFKGIQILAAGNLSNRLLTVAMEDWTSKLKGHSRLSADLLEREVISLVNHALKCSCGFDNPEEEIQTRGKAMRRYIDDLPFRVEFSAEKLCSEFGVSRASLYREFAPDGGVHRYISDRKLRKGLFLLDEAPVGRGTVTDVAVSLGYDDPLVFSKAFRTYFGFPPSDVLALRDM